MALVGTETEVKKIMVAAHWCPADPLTLRSCLEIAEASVLKRPYDDAPGSNLYLFGRKQDLAFERPVGDCPRHRNHVRFWKTGRTAEGRLVWVRSAIYDDRVGINRETGQVTHHTAANIAAERDLLFHDLQASGDLTEVYFIDGFHKIREGKNGGGDPWFTDGRLEVGIVRNMVSGGIKTAGDRPGFRIAGNGRLGADCRRPKQHLHRQQLHDHRERDRSAYRGIPAPEIG